MPERTPDTLTVLYVEDNDEDVMMVEHLVGDHVRLIHATKLAEAHRTGECDVALLDLNLEESIGIETVKRFKAGCPHIPIVVLTMVNDPQTEAACLEAGAHAVYHKSSFDPVALVRSMEAAVIAYSRGFERHKEVSVHRRSISEIKALTDGILKRLEELDDK